MRVDLMRDMATAFPQLASSESLRHLRVWHCKYKNFAPLALCVNLEELVIGSYPEGSLEILRPLADLKFLSILHMPNVTSLSPLGSLSKLESLSLATTPSWDGAGKRSIVESLEPIANLQNLKHLELFGVCPADRNLDVLKRCRGLISVRFSKYPTDEVERFYSDTGLANDYNPPSSFA